jgi:hypothetical protein
VYRRPVRQKNGKGFTVFGPPRGEKNRREQIHAMTYEKIVALDDEAQHADGARQNLEPSGVPPAEQQTAPNSVPIADEVVMRKETIETVRALRDKIRRRQLEAQKIPGE